MGLLFGLRPRYEPVQSSIFRIGLWMYTTAMSVVYTVGEFKGPIEVLLGMIESEKLPISEVSLVAVASHFLAYVKSMESFDADLVSRFLAVLATLLAIKAQSLLPTVDVSEELEADIADLEERLRMYAALKKAVKVLDKSYVVSSPLYSRESSWSSNYAFIPDKSVTIDRIIASLGDILKEKSDIEEDAADDLPQAKLRSVRSLEEIMTNIKDAVMRGESYRVPHVVTSSDPVERSEAVISFLAMLELVRWQHVSVDQDLESLEFVISQFVPYVEAAGL
jgi:segregation and condensation protein A